MLSRQCHMSTPRTPPGCTANTRLCVSTHVLTSCSTPLHVHTRIHAHAMACTAPPTHHPSCVPAMSTSCSSAQWGRTRAKERPSASVNQQSACVDGHHTMQRRACEHRSNTHNKNSRACVQAVPTRANNKRQGRGGEPRVCTMHASIASAGTGTYSAAPTSSMLCMLAGLVPACAGANPTPTLRKHTPPQRHSHEHPSTHP